MRLRHSLAVLVLLGCTTDPSSTPGPNYNPIAGSLVGPVSGTTEGTTVQGNYTLNLVQSGGSLSGSYTFVVPTPSGNITMSGSVDGTIASGDYPAVTLDLTNDACPNLKVRHTGTYDHGIKRLTLSGNLDVVNTLNSACTISLRLSTTVVLQR
jgi:hypothetical protein